MKSKCLAVGIILLFIGVAVAPSINSTVVKTSDDLVEVTSQACGIQGFGNTTVKLTKQQYQDLEQYLVEFRARLNQTTTREEAVPIFNDAVEELNKYGLLPKGMSVEKAQHFITEDNPNQRVIKTMQKIRYQSSHGDGKAIINYFCLLEASGLMGYLDWNFFTILASLMHSYELREILQFYGLVKLFFFADFIKFDDCQLSTYGPLGRVNYDRIYDVHVAFFTGFHWLTSSGPHGYGAAITHYLGSAGIVYQG